MSTAQVSQNLMSMKKKLMAFEEDTISIQGRNKHKTEYFSKFLNKTCIL